MNDSASGPLTREDVRAYGRGWLNLGYGVCLVGAVVMLLGRFRPGAPRELVYVGLAGIVFGWGLFALVIWRRVSLARRRASSLQARGLGEGTVD